MLILQMTEAFLQHSHGKCDTTNVLTNLYTNSSTWRNRHRHHFTASLHSIHSLDVFFLLFCCNRAPDMTCDTPYWFYWLYLCLAVFADFSYPKLCIKSCRTQWTRLDYLELSRYDSDWICFVASYCEKNKTSFFTEVFEFSEKAKSGWFQTHRTRG